ncbi:MAG: alpha-glucan family phosphorylase [Candidatus Altiarchaeia archaeon]
MGATDKPVINHKELIAYFSMEIGLDEKIPTYAGGLGVLAGDYIKSAADLEAPVVGLTLLNGKGFFTQRFDPEGNQREEETPWNPGKYMTPVEKVVEVPIDERRVYVKAWVYNAVGVTGYVVPVIFLDTDLIQNYEMDRAITGYLYGGDKEYRLKQEIVLGIGGVRMLDKLGIHVKKFHMNEGHSSLLGLELMNRELEKNPKKPMAHVVDGLKNRCIFTTHTPMLTGHDTFPYPMVDRVLRGYMDPALIRKQCPGDYLNMTLLGFNLSGYINGVAKKHAEVSKDMFPAYKINSVTNGVHPDTWVCPAYKRLFDRYIKDWRKDPFLFRYAIGMPLEDIQAAHAEAKGEFIDYMNREHSASMDEDTLTLGFARRMTSYKRPTFVFSDVERLKKIAKGNGGLQMVFSGKAHPEDVKGKSIIKDILSIKKALKDDIKITYIENYNMAVAKKLISGVDVWLNTPQKPKEASGTSGMKATLNGVLNLSVLDGWWIEGHIEEVTGWAIGNSEENDDKELADFYDKLEHIYDMFYHSPDRWTKMMRHALSINASFFNSHRMVEQYITNAYWD